MYNLSKLQSGFGIKLALITEIVIRFPVDGLINHLQNLMPFLKTILPNSALRVELQGVAVNKGNILLDVLPASM